MNVVAMARSNAVAMCALALYCAYLTDLLRLLCFQVITVIVVPTHIGTGICTHSVSLELITTAAAAITAATAVTYATAG
jgi:hypothetical protein